MSFLVSSFVLAVVALCQPCRISCRVNDDGLCDGCRVLAKLKPI